MVRENLDAFAASSTNLEINTVMIHIIKTGEALRFRHKLRPIPFARRQYLEQVVDKLIFIGAVFPADPCACLYAYRTVCKPNKDGTLRMRIEYREMNAQTDKDAFHVPGIDHIWPILSGTKYFASLDLLIGYHEVEVDFRDRAKTAFLTHLGLYIYNVMPFGLCNGPATFQRLMERVVGLLIGVGVLLYLNDVLIYPDTPEQLIETLGTVLKLLAKAGLNCKATKCLLFTERVHYLGRVVSKDGIYPDLAKLEKIWQWPKPDKGNGFASFLGHCNNYKDVILSFAHFSDALYKESRSELIE